MDAILPSTPRRRIGLIVGIALTILVGTTGVAAATLRHDARNQDRLVSGVRIGGVKVGGMTFAAAQSLLETKFNAVLDRPIKIEGSGKVFDVTPRQLGVTSDWQNRFADAKAQQSTMSALARVWHRITGGQLGRSYRVKVSVDAKKLENYINTVGGEVERAPKDASARYVNGNVEIIPEVTGFGIDTAAAVADLKKLVVGEGSSMKLQGHEVSPKIPTTRFRMLLLVKVGENKLYHYRDGQVVKVYDIATGKSSEPTPKGLRFVVRKRINPTWFNPAKTTWGRNMPAKIPPGPRNPLGSRVLDMSGTLARIHATFRLYSIGYNDSQGCVRMRPSDIEELFPQIEVGTPVLIVQSGANHGVPRSSRPADADSQPSAEMDAGSPPPSGGGGGESPPPQQGDPNPVPIPGQ
jgi:hypothetical protein